MLNIRQMISSDWHLMRVIRLGAGLFIAYQAWHDGSYLTGLLAGIFIFQAITNTGCCAGGSCTLPTRNQASNSRHNN